MSSVTPVLIVRPKRTPSDLWGTIITLLLRPLLRALLVWWLTPYVWDGFDLSYWQTLALVFAARSLIGTTSEDYKWWSTDKAKAATR